jgi:hypothetical protein
MAPCTRCIGLSDRELLLVRCLVRFAKRIEKGTGNMAPYKPGLPANVQSLTAQNMCPIYMMYRGRYGRWKEIPAVGF